jgi:hypothetical protein
MTVQKAFQITASGAAELADWLRTPPDLSSPPRDELVMKVLVAIRLPGTNVNAVIQAHRRYLEQLMQQWTRIKEGGAEDDLNLALAVDAELFRLDSVVRWLDAVDARLKRSTAGGHAQPTEGPNGAWHCWPGPPGVSAPNTVITEHAGRQFHLTTTAVGWIIQTPGSLTASQISTAQHAAAAAGLTVETHDSIPTFAEIIDVATVFGILLELGILAMNVGLLRSETGSDLRMLTATGAGSTARAICAATAGALALVGAIVGVMAGYIAAIGFFRTNQLDTPSSLTSIPVPNLLLILVGMPLIAVIGGWLLAGREPSAIGRRPLE